MYVYICCSVNKSHGIIIILVIFRAAIKIQWLKIGEVKYFNWNEKVVIYISWTWEKEFMPEVILVEIPHYKFPVRAQNWKEQADPHPIVTVLSSKTGLIVIFTKQTQGLEASIYLRSVNMSPKPYWGSQIL